MILDNRAGTESRSVEVQVNARRGSPPAAPKTPPAAEPRTERAPVIFMTVPEGDEREPRGRERGRADYLPTPPQGRLLRVKTAPPAGR